MHSAPALQPRFCILLPCKLFSPALGGWAYPPFVVQRPERAPHPFWNGMHMPEAKSLSGRATMGSHRGSGAKASFTGSLAEGFCSYIPLV
jgi:hypothetical protein